MANKTFVSPNETAFISRNMRFWLNSYEDKPLARLDFENLADTSGLALSVIQGAYKTHQYITGKYEAEYQFKILYRTICNSIDERLDADEALNQYAIWCEKSLPDLGENLRAKKITINSMSSLLVRYENSVEDHHIVLTLTYEVI
ncbi:MAG: hypothetical protein KBS60_03170 [Phascolarctobacterium sp.]|nr:hypothetical protein [Candidatus Phascolarctobacterium caballi]